MALKIGFTNKYFTLWDVRTETVNYTANDGSIHPHYHNTYYNYHQNLSFDKTKAIEKAKSKGCIDLTIDEDLRGVSRSWVKRETLELPMVTYLPHEFQYGKYYRKDIRECNEMGYIKWFYFQNEFHSDEQKVLLQNKIVELNPDWWVIHEGELTTHQNLEQIEEGKRIDESIKENGFFETIAPKNCDDHGHLWLGTNVRFNEVRRNEYNGYDYYLPVFNDKQTRIKNKNLRYYINRKDDDGNWIVSGLEKIK